MHDEEPGQQAVVPDTQADSKDGTSRRYAFACSGCKRRKARCDGQRPECTRCVRLKEECVYAPLSSKQDSVEWLREKLEEARTTIRSLTEAAARQSFRLPSGTETPLLLRSSAGTPDNLNSTSTNHNSDDTTDSVAELVHHMSLDAAGSLQHYGSSSLLYRRPSETSVSAKLLTQRREATESIATSRSLADQPDWQSLAYSTLLLQEQFSDAERQWQLVQTYFTWLNPEFNIVVRPVFFRDMALSGSYYNRFLLCCICAHAARFSDANLSLRTPTGTDAVAHGCGTQYLAEAKRLLMTEIEMPTSVPTIQGLMILALREAEMGHTSLAWLYSGMAWRMLRDLGLHLASKALAVYGGVGLPPMDQEIRLRLFWSAYSLDKCISMALGRSPTFNAYQRQRPNMMTDTTEDSELWSPLSIDGSSLHHFSSYTGVPSHSASNARYMATLCMIVSDVMLKLYMRRPDLNHCLEFLDEMQRRLLSWFRDWPQAVRFPAAVGAICPPPHVFSLNLLYRAVTILLHRPYLETEENISLSEQTRAAISNSVRIATSMAEETDMLFELHRQAFGLCHLTYTMLYCCYLSASVNVLDFLTGSKSESNTAAARLSRSFRVLEKGASQSPALHGTIEILKNRLRASPTLGKRGRTSVGNSATQSHKRQQTSSERSLDASSGYGNLAAGAQADNQGSGQQQAAQIITSDTPNSDWAVNLLMQSVAASDQGQPPLPSSTPSLELATNDQIFLQGDVFGTGVMMPMGTLFDIDNYLSYQ